MNTAMMLMVYYGGLPVIPVENVATDHFSLTPERLLRKIRDGDIDLPLVEMEESQKGRKGVMVADLASYIDTRAELARDAAKKRKI